MTKFNLIDKRLYFYVLSLLLFLTGVIAPYFYKLNFGIDLIGGEVLEIKTNLPVDRLETITKEANIQASIISAQDSLILKGKILSKDLLMSEIKKQDIKAEILRFETTSPSLSGELRKKAWLSIILVLFGIGIYISLAFRKKSGKINGWLLGAVVILTLLHDVISSFGFFVILSKYLDLTFDIMVITGFLVIAGFSVHDTIVVFDRLRENLGKVNVLNKDLFNKSVAETMARSINTSLTAVLAILPLLLLMPHLHSFLMPLIFGIIIGTYSSIFIAVPLVYDFTK